ncbi:MAG: type II secretion system protein [Candidatus Gracilibacteria bacterium]
MKNRFGKLGFTLIELLIVITIIGILAVVFLPSILSAPEKSRDAARKAEVGSIVEGIEAARLDGKVTWDTDVKDGCASAALSPTVQSYLANGIVPKDPKSDNVFGTLCTGEYMVLVDKAATFKYAVVAKVEIPEKNGNVVCPTTIADSPNLAAIAPAPATTCYFAKSQ